MWTFFPPSLFSDGPLFRGRFFPSGPIFREPFFRGRYFRGPFFLHLKCPYGTKIKDCILVPVIFPAVFQCCFSLGYKYYLLTYLLT